MGEYLKVLLAFLFLYSKMFKIDVFLLCDVIIELYNCVDS